MGDYIRVDDVFDIKGVVSAGAVDMKEINGEKYALFSSIYVLKEKLKSKKDLEKIEQLLLKNGYEYEVIEDLESYLGEEKPHYIFLLK